MNIRSLILSALMAFGLTACNQGEKPAKQGGNQKADSAQDLQRMASSGLKVAYVNTDSVLTQYEMVKDLEEQILEEKLTLEGRYKAKVKQLEKEYAYAQQEAPNLSPDKLEMLQMEFAQKEQELMRSKQQLEQQFMESEQNQNERLYENIQDFLASYSISEGYDIIFGYNGFGNVLYAADRFDITQTVVDSLNTLYQAEKTKKGEVSAK